MTEPVPPGLVARDAGEAEVVPLGAEPVERHDVVPPTGPTSRLHALAIGGMALFALAGIGSMLAFVTVRWTGTTGRLVAGAVVLSAIGFLACASAAVFTAARDTYAEARRDSVDGES